MPKLTEKQQRFIEAYTAEASGNATEAARVAGYAEPQSQGPRLLKNVAVQQAIERATDQVRQRAIATREERQRFFTAMMRGDFDEPTVTPDGSVIDSRTKSKERLRAAELLCKMQGDFIERLDVKLVDLVGDKLDQLEQSLPPDAYAAVLEVLDKDGDS